MYVVTNRELKQTATDLSMFTDRLNRDGSHVLRLVDVAKRGAAYACTALDDQLTKAEVKALKSTYKLNIDENGTWWASLKIACELFTSAMEKGKNLVFFSHGYNNDIKDVLVTAAKIEAAYGVIVVIFSWPSNGTKLSYLSDKDDARQSAVALSRFAAKIDEYHRLLTEANSRRMLDKAIAKHPDNHEEARALYSRLVDAECKVSLNLVCHSMGNYVFKYSTLPSSTYMTNLVFDNIALIAADVNNRGHASWLETINVRNRLYVVINENDSALKWSRRKPGDAQKARLGHYLKGLAAENATYIDITHSTGVGSEHSYFKGSPITKNKKLKAMFSGIFNGGTVENSLAYRSDINAYTGP